MAFKDNWRPRIDNVDDADVSAVNEIAEAVINNEENIKTINEKTYSKQEANTLFANALKGSATGSAVRMDDVSPVAHEMAVKVSGVDDVSAVKVQRYGKNLINVDGMLNDQLIKDGDTYVLTKSSAGRFSKSTKVYIPAHTPVVFSANKIEYTGKSDYWLNFSCGCVDGTTAYAQLTSTKPKAITFDKPIKSISMYLQGDDTLDSYYLRFSDLQIELGETATATEYEPYIEPMEYPVNADGTVEGVTSLSPTTTLMTDTEGAVIDVEYNRDLNKAFAALEGIVNALIVG